MPTPLQQDLIYGWVSGSNVRDTRDILVSSLSTIWLCTWTSLCLNIPTERVRERRHRWLLHKFYWQLFAIFFPEVLVATAAEQWLSARQSARAFARLGYPQWTVRHAFFADMGGIVVAPPDFPPFPVDSQQLAYVVEHEYLELPNISTDDTRSLNKADGLARIVTLAQMAWYLLSCAARGATGLGFYTLEVTTLAYILCTIHTFFFWYFKPLDPEAQRVFALSTSMAEICERSGHVGGPNYLQKYTHTPLDFVKPLPDPKSLITPFWSGLGATMANSRVLPQDGISTALMVYTLLFQVVYFGLHIGFSWITSFPSDVEWYMWMASNAVDFGLIAIYVLAIPAGQYFAPFLGRWLFDIEATHLLQVASALHVWAKVLIHGPFVLGYVAARAAVLVEPVLSLRALPESVYRDCIFSAGVVLGVGLLKGHRSRDVAAPPIRTGFRDAVITHYMSMRRHDLPASADHPLRRRANFPTRLKNVFDVYYIIDLVMGNQTVPVSIDTGSSGTWLGQEPYEFASYWYETSRRPILCSPPACGRAGRSIACFSIALLSSEDQGGGALVNQLYASYEPQAEFGVQIGDSTFYVAPEDLLR
ncbi:hypothetical protein VTK56DRAFT_836 [Thermocarpiscus australiensis]